MAFVMVLSGIFHSRVEYPDMPTHRSSGQESIMDKKSQEDTPLDKECNNMEDDLNR